MNLTNHPSTSWPSSQMEVCARKGQIVDMPFPAIPAEMKDKELDQLVEQYLQKILGYEKPSVLLQGEFVFTFRLAQKLILHHIPVFAAITERQTAEIKNSDDSITKISQFVFRGLRCYGSQSVTGDRLKQTPKFDPAD